MWLLLCATGNASSGALPTDIFEPFALAVSSPHPAAIVKGETMPDRRRRRIQFVSDALVQEIVDGIKTASVVDLGTATDILQGLVSRRDAEALEVTQLQHEVFQ